MKELEEAIKTTEVSELEKIAVEREENAEFKWLSDNIKVIMKDSIEKAAKGVEITKHNDMIIKMVGIEPSIKTHITSRKTKKGQAFYGYETELYNAVRDAATSDGLPAL